MPAPAHPAPGWWSWLRPKRSAFSTIIRAALGTSTPTSMTVVDTKTWSSPSGEGGHDGLLLPGLHLTVE